MATFERFKELRLRPLVFYGNNPISLIGGALYERVRPRFDWILGRGFRRPRRF